jgi:hypothetical protein
VPRFRLSALAGALLAILLSGCALLGGELPPRETRLTSPDGRTDLVLTWRGGGGAAGWAEEHIALVRHGEPTEDGDDIAVLEPEELLGARWLANDVVEVGLDGTPEGEALPKTVHLDSGIVELHVRDFGGCRLAVFRNLPQRSGLSIRLTAWNCGGGVGRLALSAREDGFWAELADQTVHWPTALVPTVRGEDISQPAGSTPVGGRGNG